MPISPNLASLPPIQTSGFAPSIDSAGPSTPFGSSSSSTLRDGFKSDFSPISAMAKPFLPEKVLSATGYASSRMGTEVENTLNNANVKGGGDDGRKVQKVSAEEKNRLDAENISLTLLHGGFKNATALVS